MQSQMVRKATITRLNFGIGLLTLFLTIFGYLLYLLTLSLVNSNKEYDIIVFLFSWVGILLGFYICFTWYKITKVIFTPYIIFMLFFFLFNYGQPLMWAFGIHNSMEIGEASLYGLGIANTNDIIKAQALTLVSILMFHAGALFCYKTESQNITVDNQLEKHERDKTNTFKAIYYTCFLVGLIVIPATLIFSFVDLQTALTYGYNSLYYSDHARSGLNLTVLEHLFFPCLVGLLIGSRFNKKVLFSVYTIFTIYLLLNAFSGDRGSWVYKIIILVWLSHACYKTLNLKKTTKYVLVSIVGLYIVDVIRSLRNTGISVEGIISSLSLRNSPFINTIFEMGASMQPLIVLQKYGWDVWPYANTYIVAILGMATNNVLDLLNIPFSLVGTWFREYLGITWGPAFSIIAEAVLNFGPFLAPFFMIVLGYIITSFIYIDNKMNYKERPLKLFFIVSTLHAIIPIARNSSHLLLKNWFYGVVVLCITILVVKFLVTRYSKK